MRTQREESGREGEAKRRRRGEVEWRRVEEKNQEVRRRGRDKERRGVEAEGMGEGGEAEKRKER